MLPSRALYIVRWILFKLRDRKMSDDIAEYVRLITAAFFVVSGAGVAAWALPRFLHHLCTAVAVVVLSILVALFATHIFGSWIESIHGMSEALPPPLDMLARSVRPIATANVLSPVDVMSVCVLFYSAYAVFVVIRRLVDTSRILKVSRRRLVQLAQ